MALETVNCIVTGDGEPPSGVCQFLATSRPLLTGYG